MGIKGLSKLLGDQAPGCLKEHELKTFFGRKIAIDASMSIYQFLVAVRQGADNLTNANGDITSHLSGLFYRTVRLMELGIKPIYVFDGKPPTMKSAELQKRVDAKRNAEQLAEAAQEEGDIENYTKYSRRVNRVTPEMIQQCKELIRLMGVPVVEAPCEAEAQCAELCKGGLVYAMASEDMDSLTLGTPRLVRQLWAGAGSSAEKKGVRPMEFLLENTLSELELSMDQFIDLCIMLGCDYVDSIRGIGPVTALKLIREHGSLEKIVELCRSGTLKHTIPDEYPIDEVRELFKNAEVVPCSDIQLKWKAPDEEGLIELLVNQNQFSETNIRNGIKKLNASRTKGNQGRLDGFFKTVPRTTPTLAGTKRVQADNKAAKGSKGTAKKVRGAK
uniref:Flap endonuclease 1 n=1 Tax=Timspurckia oligopyrenoides TaxID=708627 RepID=A0A7S0ZF90_9RHOD|mmetsp:Transcript_2987/g.5265  ORF Transcript_2987/g.5265 Transcript_2987/m.5265 type:complete len:389 (+) Transcript_2987:112-1278(+)